MGRRKMVETSTSYCRQCEYHYGGDNALISCDYLLRTGKRRKCPVGKCDKFKQKETNRKEIPWSEASNLFQHLSSEKLMKQTKTLKNT